MPETVLKRWVDAVNARRIDDILCLYAEDATLIPTFSPRPARSLDDIRQYFERLCARPDTRVETRPETVSVQHFTGGVAAVSGVYRFRVEAGGGPSHVEARFSLIVAPGEPRPILHHHSSETPSGKE